MRGSSRRSPSCIAWFFIRSDAVWNMPSIGVAILPGPWALLERLWIAAGGNWRCDRRQRAWPLESAAQHGPAGPHARGVQRNGRIWDYSLGENLTALDRHSAPSAFAPRLRNPLVGPDRCAQMLRQALDLSCKLSGALAVQGAESALPGALATALRALGASQLRGFTRGTPQRWSPRYQARGLGCLAATAAAAGAASPIYVPLLAPSAVHALACDPASVLPPALQVTGRSMMDDPVSPSTKNGATVVLASGGIESAALLSCERPMGSRWGGAGQRGGACSRPRRRTATSNREFAWLLNSAPAERCRAAPPPPSALTATPPSFPPSPLFSLSSNRLQPLGPRPQAVPAIC